jgi:hypothetical protein
MTKDEIIKALRDMAKYPTVTLPRDCEALRAAADLLAQPERELNNQSVIEDIQQLCINGELPWEFEYVCDWIEKGKLPNPPAAQRKPLTNDEISRIDDEIMKSPRGYCIKFTRAVEAAHGIKEGT